MNRLGCLIVVAMLGLITADEACAQGKVPAAAVDTIPQTGIYTVKVKVQAVVLDVVVTNPKGSPVPNLTVDDFTVYEDKVAQKILNFDRTTPETAGPHGGAPVPVHSTAELDRQEPGAPVGILVLDEITTEFADKAFVRYSLKKYLDTQGEVMQPTMLMAVSLDHRQVLRDYTTSKAELLEALEKHLATVDFRSTTASWMNGQLNAALTALTSVAQATAGHAGHKNVIWVGRGFPTLDVSRVPPQDLATIEGIIAQLANTLRDSRVTLYSIDPQGVSSNAFDEDGDGFLNNDPFGSTVSFDVLARSTGGQGFHGSNDIKGLIGTSMRDGQTFYTITYRPNNESDHGRPFRNITVKMKDATLLASTRQGYYDRLPPPPPTLDAKGGATPRTLFDLMTAAAGLLVYDGIPLAFERDPTHQDQFTLKLRASSFDWSPNPDNATQFSPVTVLYNSYDRKGKLLLQKAYSEQLVSPILDAAHLATNEVRLPITIPSAPPAARLRIVIRANSSGRIGADNVYLVDRKTLTDPETGVKAQQPKNR